jgi:hypothetical protein
MIRAILDGRKTQTRRVVKPQPRMMPLDMGEGIPMLPMLVFKRRGFGGGWLYPNALDKIIAECPYGVAGDRLWVRETWQPIWADENNPPTTLKCHEGWNIGYPASDGIQEYLDHGEDLTSRCRPAIHMPRWASRIVLEIADIHIESLQRISGMDAKREGVAIPSHMPEDGADLDWARREFQALWDLINCKRGFGWSANPFVWAISFRRLSS